MFILMYTVSYIGGGNLLRFAEGATFLSIVSVSNLKNNRNLFFTMHPCSQHSLSNFKIYTGLSFSMLF